MVTGTVAVAVPRLGTVTVHDVVPEQLVDAVVPPKEATICPLPLKKPEPETTTGCPALPDAGERVVSCGAPVADAVVEVVVVEPGGAVAVVVVVVVAGGAVVVVVACGAVVEVDGGAVVVAAGAVVVGEDRRAFVAGAVTERLGDPPPPLVSTNPTTRATTITAAAAVSMRRPLGVVRPSCCQRLGGRGGGTAGTARVGRAFRDGASDGGPVCTCRVGSWPSGVLAVTGRREVGCGAGVGRVGRSGLGRWRVGG